MGFGLHNATDAPRSSRTGVGHAGAAIFERSTLGWPLFVVASAYDRFHVFFDISKTMILVFHTSRFEFPLPEEGRGVRRRRAERRQVGGVWAE